MSPNISYFNDLRNQARERTNSKLAYGVPLFAMQRALVLFQLARIAQCLQVDPELLTFLVEVAAFQAQHPRDIGHVEIVTPDFPEQHFLFECFGPLRQGPRSHSAGCKSTSASGIEIRQCDANICGADGSVRREQDKSF